MVVTGLSGSGKTAALKSLEDLGFFCIDNLPVALLPKVFQLGVFSGGMVNKIAVGMDSREPAFLDGFSEAFAEVERLGIETEVVYLESDDAVLLRRFSETRRVHPLAQDRSISESIGEERKLFAPVRDRAAWVLDTSKMTVHELKRTLWDHFRQGADEGTLVVSLMSFGFRNGTPAEADLVLDVRFLPNPYFVDALKGQTGQQAPVQEFVFSTEAAQSAVAKIGDLLCYLLPLYEAEGKTYLTVAIGCTGGKHRSVAVVERLERTLREAGRQTRVQHRDIAK